MLDFDDVTSDGFYDMGIGGDYASLKVMAAKDCSQNMNQIYIRGGGGTCGACYLSFAPSYNSFIYIEIL